MKIKDKDLLELDEELDDLDSELTTGFEKEVKKKLKKKEDQVIYRFNYYNPADKICVNTMVSDDQEGKPMPTFVVYNGNTKEYYLTKELFVSEGYKLCVPPTTGLYGKLYRDIVFPNTIITDEVKMGAIDEKITENLKAWNLHPEEYYIIARNFIKFTWLFERFQYRPYLYLYGDWGTGKSSFGKHIVKLCQNGFVMMDVSAPALARMLDMTNSVIMLDEMEKLDKADADRMNTILRNGYEWNGAYVVAEAESKKFSPTMYYVDQPKILCRRQMTKDDALRSRIIPFNMIPRDKDIPDSMRKSDERDFHEQRRLEAVNITNLLLKWRWQNLFGFAPTYLVPGMVARFNDTIMSILKMGTKEDQEIIIRFMKRQERVAIDSASDDYRIQVIKFIQEWVERKTAENILGTPGERLYITDIVEIAKEFIEMSEIDFKRAWNTRYIRRVIMDLGFETESFRNKNYIKTNSLTDLLPRLVEKYNLKVEEGKEEKTKTDGIKDNPVDNLIDTDIDKSII